MDLVVNDYSNWFLTNKSLLPISSHFDVFSRTIWATSEASWQQSQLDHQQSHRQSTVSSPDLALIATNKTVSVSLVAIRAKSGLLTAVVDCWWSSWQRTVDPDLPAADLLATEHWKDRERAWTTDSDCKPKDSKHRVQTGKGTGETWFTTTWLECIASYRHPAWTGQLLHNRQECRN